MVKQIGRFMEKGSRTEGMHINKVINYHTAIIQENIFINGQNLYDSIANCALLTKALTNLLHMWLTPNTQIVVLSSKGEKASLYIIALKHLNPKNNVLICSCKALPQLHIMD